MDISEEEFQQAALKAKCETIRDVERLYHPTSLPAQYFLNMTWLEDSGRWTQLNYEFPLTDEGLVQCLYSINKHISSEKKSVNIKIISSP